MKKIQELPNPDWQKGLLPEEITRSLPDGMKVELFLSWEDDNKTYKPRLVLIRDGNHFLTASDLSGLLYQMTKAFGTLNMDAWGLSHDSCVAITNGAARCTNSMI